MNKPRNYTIGLYVALLLLVFGFGYFMMKYGSDDLVVNNTAFFYIIVLVISFVVTAFAFEIGHLIGAKASGYDVVSSSIFGFSIGRVNGNPKFFYTEKYKGFLGEINVNPKKENANPKGIFINGFVSVLVVNAILLAVNFIVPDMKSLAPKFYYGVIFGCPVSMAFALYGMLPINVDSLTDGVALRSIKQDKGEAFNKLSKLYASISEGEKLPELELMETVNPLVCEYNFLAVDGSLYNGNYEKAGQIVDHLIANSSKVSVLSFDKIVPSKLVVLSKSMAKDEFVEYYSTKVDEKFKASINKLDTIEKCRAYLIVSGLFLDNETAVSNVLRKYGKLIDQIRFNGIKEQEKQFADNVLKEILDAHAEWNVNW